MEDIFTLSVSKKEQEFISSGRELELDVSSDIVETFYDIPYVGSLLKLDRIGSKFHELHFIRKLARFLEKEKDIPKQEKEKFLNSLTSKHRNRLYEYLTHYLLRAEDDAKADIMGYIYQERVYNHIDDELFLRLCSIIDRSFVFDLKSLPEYEKEIKDYNEYDSIKVNALMNLGLIDNEIDNGGWGNRTIIELNEIGLELHRILKQNGWY